MMLAHCPSSPIDSPMATAVLLSAAAVLVLVLWIWGRHG